MALRFAACSPESFDKKQYIRTLSENGYTYVADEDKNSGDISSKYSVSFHVDSIFIFTGLIFDFDTIEEICKYFNEKSHI